MKNLLLSLVAIVGLSFLPGCATHTSFAPFTRSAVVADGQTNDVFTVNTNLLAAIETAKRVNASINPTPSEPIINLGLSAVTAALGAGAWFLNRRKRSLQDQLTAVIGGIETATRINPSVALVKSEVANAADLLGVATELHTTVKNQT